MQTILVTGGAGFIGSALVRYLVSEATTSVVNVDKLTYAGNRDSRDANWNVVWVQARVQKDAIGDGWG